METDLLQNKLPIKLKEELCRDNSVRKIFGARAWMNMYTDSFIHIHRDQMQRNHNLPTDSQQLGSQRYRRLTQKELWCHGHAELVETHAEKGAFAPNFTGLLHRGRLIPI